ncbi:MAG: bacillolysin [Maribacter sp.]|jgi:bacillolysin
MKKGLVFIISIFLFQSILSAQSSFDVEIDRLKSETQANITVNYHTGNASFIQFPREAPLVLEGNSIIEKVNSFFDRYENVFIENATTRWIEKESDNDILLNTHHITLLQYVNDIPVFGSELKFHFDAALNITAINGHVFPSINVNLSPIIQEDIIRSQMIEKVSNKYDLSTSYPLSVNEISLYYYREGTIQNKPMGKDYLVYFAEISNAQGVKEAVFIDAQTGKLVESYSAICHLLERRLYENNLNNLIWEENAPFPGNLDVWEQKAIVSTIYTYNFFKNTFGHISYDDNDAPMLIVDESDQINCPNATWNGTSTNFCIGVGSDDVVAHEWGHAYTEYTSDLIYAWQSGALNEAYSDIWGETIDLINNYDDYDEDLSERIECNSSERWLLGEDASGIGGALRDMWNPNCRNHPAGVLDTMYYCEDGDNGGVHRNSGIINHVYVLLVDGGSYNDQIINSIGMTKAAHIFWRAQIIYLNPVSDFVDFADALEASCMDLLGVNLENLSTATPLGLSGESITLEDCLSVSAVIEATQLRAAPDCNWQPLLMSDAPTICEEVDSIFYEDFENGLIGWIQEGLPVNPASWDLREWTIESELPDDREGSAIFVPNPVIGDCQGDLENGIVRLESPVIDIPGGDEVFPHLSFEHYVVTEGMWDGGNIKYNLDNQGWEILPTAAFSFNPYNLELNGGGNDNPMAGEPAFSGRNQGSLFGSWGESQIDLNVVGATGGSSIQLRWELGEDGCNGAIGWYVDNILVYTCNTGTVANENALTNDNITISPNPFEGRILIELGNDTQGQSQIDIIDISGKMVFSKSQIVTSSSSLVLDELDYMSLGIYIIRVQVGDKLFVQKIVKI